MKLYNVAFYCCFAVAVVFLLTDGFDVHGELITHNAGLSVLLLWVGLGVKAYYSLKED